MRLVMVTWVRAYLSPRNNRVDVLRGHPDRDVQRFLNEHCSANPAENLQSAADVLEQKLLAGSAAK
jgi:hypothetical protein